MRLRFGLAGPEDDAALAEIARTPTMPGRIRACFEPAAGYLETTRLLGRETQVIVARDGGSGRIVGCGTRTVGVSFVNGEPAPFGYLANLRTLPEARGGSAVARGYAFLRELHGDSRAAAYATTIMTDNAPAMALLTSGRAGLPAYLDMGLYRTLVFSPAARRRLGAPAVTVTRATPDRLGKVLAFLTEQGRRRQFFPCVEPADLAPGGWLASLGPEGFRVAESAGKIVGVVGAWDQRRVRRLVIHGYAPTLRVLRPLAGLAARARGLPTLPRPGVVDALFLALVAIAEDDGAVLRSLLASVLEEAAGRFTCVLLGLHEADPLLAALAEVPRLSLSSRLFLVTFGEPPFVLDGRPSYLELGAL